MHQWEEWQSYRKDRGTPPWIKVHRNLLSNHKWVSLTDAEKGQLVSMWIVAADSDGILPDDARLIRKMAGLDEVPNLERFKELNWVTPHGCQLDVNVASSGCQSDAPETEAETETEEPKEVLATNTKAKRNDAGTSITTQFGDNPICPDEWANFSSREFGWSQGRIESTFASFVDYWRGIPGAKGRKSDWPATWRTWCRRDNERTPRGSGQAGGRMPDRTATALGGLLARGNAVRDEGGAFGRNEGVLPDLEA
jgi:hypothetical protein